MGRWLLGSRLTQQIVDEVAATLSQNINLMDDHGVIVASRDPSRIGHPHPGARSVLTTGQAVTVRAGEQGTDEPGADLRGSDQQPGVNLPLRAGDEVVGVVGVTGDPDQIAPLAQVVRLATQLLLDQAAAQDAHDRREAADRGLLTALLLGEDSPGAITDRLTGSERGIPAPWRLAALLPGPSGDLPDALSPADLSPLAAGGVRWASLRGALWLLSTESERTDQLLAEVAEAASLRAITAPATTDPAALRSSGRALLALVQRPALLTGTEPVTPLDHLSAELAVAHLPPEQRALLAERIAPLTAPQRETVTALAQHGRSSDTGRDLHAHRNTVAQRVERIRHLTGLDPRDPRELLTLTLAVTAARFGADG